MNYMIRTSCVSDDIWDGANTFAESWKMAEKWAHRLAELGEFGAVVEVVSIVPEGGKMLVVTKDVGIVVEDRYLPPFRSWLEQEKAGEPNK